MYQARNISENGHTWISEPESTVQVKKHVVVPSFVDNVKQKNGYRIVESQAARKAKKPYCLS